MKPNAVAEGSRYFYQIKNKSKHVLKVKGLTKRKTTKRLQKLLETVFLITAENEFCIKIAIDKRKKLEVRKKCSVSKLLDKRFTWTTYSLAGERKPLSKL